MTRSGLLADLHVSESFEEISASPSTKETYAGPLIFFCKVGIPVLKKDHSFEGEGIKRYSCSNSGWATVDSVSFQDDQCLVILTKRNDKLIVKDIRIQLNQC